ncbi:MAG: peptidase, partial [Acidobacteria bacterium]
MLPRCPQGRLLAALFVIALVTGPLSAAAQKVPAPEEVSGFKIGADYHLATYAQAHKYYTMLAQASPLIRVFEVGKTPLDRPMVYAVITSAENMAKLDRYKEIARRLSLVKGVDPDEARKLAAEGRAVVYIDGGLHASECAPAQHLIQLAYDLVTGTDEETRQIRDQVITVLVFANPD